MHCMACTAWPVRSAGRVRACHGKVLTQARHSKEPSQPTYPSPTQPQVPGGMRYTLQIADHGSRAGRTSHGLGWAPGQLLKDAEAVAARAQDALQ